MFFRNIIGHEEIKRRLIRTVREGTVPQAYLFCGASGVGKLGMALAYARYLNCTSRGEDDACGVCPSCRQMTTMMHPDVHYSFPVYKSDKRRSGCSDDYIAEWRDALSRTPYLSREKWSEAINSGNSQLYIYADEAGAIIRKLSYKSFESEYKILIMWSPESMRTECANSLLKLIEEPYDKTLFILVSDSPEKLLPTIVSRTRILRFRTVPDDLVSSRLQADFSLDSENADEVARISNGSYRKAVEIIQQTEENDRFFNLFVAMMRNAYARRIKEMKAWSEETGSLGREAEKRFLQYSQRMLRENYIYNTRVSALTYMTKREKEFSVRFSPFINEKNVIEIMEALSNAERDIIQNANGKIVFFDLSIKMILLIKRAAS